MLSVVLATHNEADNLGRCLSSVTSIASEIVIIDGASTDATLAIAKKFHARVIHTTNKPMFHINKQLALDKARGDWILQLDADEEVSPKLAAEIKSILLMSESKIRSRHLPAAKTALFKRHQQALAARDGTIGTPEADTVAFFIPRRNLFLGKPLLHGGVYPDGVIRLVKKNHAHFPCKSVHEQISIDGRVDWLEHDLLHHDSPTFQKYFARANRYTSLTATNLKTANLKPNIFNSIYYLIIKPKFTFLSIYFLHKGFLDGFPGFMWALFSGLHWPMAYLKYWQLVKNPSTS